MLEYPTQSDARVVVSSNHYLTYPDQVALLDKNGQVVGEYWHAGHLLVLAQADLDGDGQGELLFGGIDNTQHQATLVVLDPGKVSGLFRSSQSGPLQFVNLAPVPMGVEKMVVRFPKSCFVKAEQHNQVTNVRVTKDRVVIAVAEGPDINRNAGLVIYEFDHHMNVL